MSEYISLDPSEHTKHKEILEPEDTLAVFEDGQTAQLFEREGDIIEWDMHKHAHPETSTMSRMLLVTESGNEYIMGKGYIINRNERVAKRIHGLPEGLPNPTVGESWDVPGFSHTTKIKAVMLRYKMATEKQMEEASGENPFIEAEQLIGLAEQHDK